MRRVFVRSLIAVTAAIALVSGWIIGGRSLSMLLDRIHTVEIERRAVTAFALEDATAERIRIDEMPMNTRMPHDRPPLAMTTDGQRRFVVTLNGKSITLGSPGELTEDHAGAVIRPGPGEDATFSISRSYLSWPTPFDFNFMTGHSPSWKRHLYYRLVWRKPDGANFEMLWRYEQYFYPNDGWASGFMTHEGSTGLLRANVQH